MDLTLTPDQELIRTTARELLGEGGKQKVAASYKSPVAYPAFNAA